MTDAISGKLAILAPTDYAHFPAGGTKAFLTEFLLALPGEVAQRTTLVGMASGDSCLAGIEERVFGRNTYPFLRLGAWDGERSVRLRFLQLVWSSWALIRELQADTLYVHNVEAAALCAVRGFTGRLVLHCHGVDNPIKLGRFAVMRTGLPIWIYDHWLLPFAVGKARHVFVTASHHDVLRFSKRHRNERRVDRIPAIIDGFAFAPQDRRSARRELGLPDESPVGVVVGRLEQAKGVQTVLEAFRLLMDQDVTARLLVVGDGSYRATLERMAHEFGLQGSTRFLGVVERRRLPRILSAADVYMSGSWREGFSMALVEALACGVPVVVTDAGAAGEIVVNGENGYTIPIGDAREMARRFKMVASMRDELRDRCITTVEAFRPRTVVRSMLPALGFQCVA